MTTAAEIMELRQELCAAHQLLPDNNLVVSTAGNISVRHPDGFILIKPSGMKYKDMGPMDMVRVTLEQGLYGRGEFDLKPSTDLESHLVVYRALPWVNSIVHTHSTFATAFAANGQAIPCCLTAIADEFGGGIPCGDYARIGGDFIGKELLKVMACFADHRRLPAILMKSHGVFTFGKDIDAAVKAAMMVEDVAKTVYHAIQMLGPEQSLRMLPVDEIAIAHDRYINRYGQH